MRILEAEPKGCLGDAVASHQEILALIYNETMYIADGGAAGGKTITATLVKNSGTDKLREILSKGPLTYTSSDNGFETYGDIGQTLPTSNESITAAPGDILLYASRYICIFWGPNTYSYTRLGRIEGTFQGLLLFRPDYLIHFLCNQLRNSRTFV